MPSGLPDFWQGTIAGMPTIGAGQVAWYMSEADLVDGEGSSDLINYVVPDLMELHVCSGIVSCGMPRLQRYELMSAPGGSWISPTSYIDPDDKWDDEENAYDGDPYTFARNARGDYNHYLELLLSTPRNCNKVRFKARGWPPGPFVPSGAKVDVDVYYEGDWHNIFSGTGIEPGWNEVDIGATKLVHSARIRGIDSYLSTALQEFEFNTYGATAQEGIYFDTHAIIPYLPQAPYIVEAGATFAVRVYNDDEEPQNMSVSIAGFLQSKV